MDRQVFTRREYASVISKYRGQLRNLSYTVSLEKLVISLFMMEPQIQEIELIKDNTNITFSINSSSKLESYTLNYIRQNKEIGYIYDIIVRRKISWFIWRTLQEVTI